MIYADYPGHKLTLFGYQEQDAGSYDWTESVLGLARFTTGTVAAISLTIPPFVKAYYLFLLIEMDTTIAPRFYDDCIVLGITYPQNNIIYIQFGFP